MTDMHLTVEDHSIRIALLEQAKKEHAEAIKGLQESEKAILVRLEMTATKEDMMGLRGHFDEGLNGVLRDAINAVPQHAAVATAKRANVWLAVAAVGTVLAGFMGMAAFFVEHVK